MNRLNERFASSKVKLTKQETRILSLLLYYCNSHIGHVYETFIYEDEIREEDIAVIAKKLGVEIPK